ncbi:carboxylesterase SOBER1-like [Momordica charantia]|uniref:Carboxylesterase SOBER1-like n=1 Tax=Momordica charantia TaxID=3673 RepID=A0A6J1BV43_MOMCH|nr:carboxylesterase SOBER1-like [Momordica charantia]
MMGMGEQVQWRLHLFLVLIIFGCAAANTSDLDPIVGRSFIVWLHGLGDSGPPNQPIMNLFTAPEFDHTSWSFPSAPPNPVTALDGAVIPSWFDILELPVTAASPNAESSVLEAVQRVHAMIDDVVDGGINPNNIFICGFSQGGALTLANVLLYSKTLGGGAVFSGWAPLNNSTIIDQIHPDAKRTPILWSHGMDDMIVLPEAGEAGVRFLEKAGLDCEFKAYPGVGHSTSIEELRNLVQWIKSRLKTVRFEKECK